MGARYLEALCKFWGIPRFDVVAADGLDLGWEAFKRFSTGSSTMHSHWWRTSKNGKGRA
jgi:FMN-dependent NADH-azoreductase